VKVALLDFSISLLVGEGFFVSLSCLILRKEVYRIMAIDFFDNEAIKLQNRFNETFGDLQAFNISARFSFILAIVHIGMLAKELNQQNKKKDILKIKEFMRIKEILNKAFDNAFDQACDKAVKGSSDSAQKGKENKSHGRYLTDSRDFEVRKLRKCLQG